MTQWNVVISVHEHGFKKALDMLSEFGRVKGTGFFNVLLMEAEDSGGMLEALRSRQERAPEELAFLARVAPVERTFLFSSKEEFESKAREMVLGWSLALSGHGFTYGYAGGDSRAGSRAPMKSVCSMKRCSTRFSRAAVRGESTSSIPMRSL